MITTFYKVPVSPPLDIVGGAAVAVGLHKLRSAYAGMCCRIRRSSDNTEQDIGFKGLDLDIAVYNAFVGNATGYVTILYDQSGNGYNAVQTVAVNQPALIPVFHAGRPAILFTSSSQNFLSFGTALGRPPDYTIVSAFSITDLTQMIWIYGSASTNGYACWGSLFANRTLGNPNRLPGGNLTWGHANISAYAYDTVNAIMSMDKLAIISESYASGVRPEEIRKNSVITKPLDTNGSAISCDGPAVNFSIGRIGDYNMKYLDGYFTDFIQYSSKLTDTQQAAIEYSINDYYSIF